MSVRPQDLVFLAGGQCLQKYGTIVRGVTPTVSRTGTNATMVGPDGRILSAAANTARVEWLDLDGDGVLDTPALLQERAQTNLVSSWDLTSWSTVGSPTVTGSITDPAGGTAAYEVDDDDGGVLEGVSTPSDLGFGSDGEKGVAIALRAAGATVNTDIQVRDITAGSTARHRIRVAFTDGVPATPTTASGAGTAFAPQPLYDDWWLIRFTAENIVAANDNRLDLWPATAVASGTGTMQYYGPTVVDSPAISSLIPAAATRNADLVSAPFYVPPTALTAYVKFQRRDRHLDTPVYLQIGGTAASANRLLVFVSGTDDQLYTSLISGGSTVAQSVTPNGLDDFEVGEVLAVLEDGTLTTSLRVDGGAVTPDASPATGFALPTAWTLPIVHVGGLGSAANQATSPIIAAKIALGSYTMDEMEAAL